MIVFAESLLLEKRGLMAGQTFLVTVVILEFELLKYCFLHVLESLMVCTCPKFIKLTTQSPPYQSFCCETIVVISDPFLFVESQ